MKLKIFMIFVTLILTIFTKNLKVRKLKPNDISRKPLSQLPKTPSGVDPLPTDSPTLKKENSKPSGKDPLPTDSLTLKQNFKSTINTFKPIPMIPIIKSPFDRQAGNKEGMYGKRNFYF